MPVYQPQSPHALPLLLPMQEHQYSSTPSSRLYDAPRYPSQPDPANNISLHDYHSASASPFPSQHLSYPPNQAHYHPSSSYPQQQPSFGSSSAQWANTAPVQQDSFTTVRESAHFSEFGSDDQSVSSASSLPTPQSLYVPLEWPTDAPQYGVPLGSPSSAYASSSSMSPGAPIMTLPHNASNPLHHMHQQRQPHPFSPHRTNTNNNVAGTQSPALPSSSHSPYSPVHLTPALSGLSIDSYQQQHDGHHPQPQTPTSPNHPSIIQHSSPSSRHRSRPSSSSHSIPRDSPAHQAHRHSSASSSSHPYHTHPYDDSNRPAKAMIPGTPTHPDIPRPAVVPDPVPVPNLTKKSRGRQVPSISTLAASAVSPSSPHSSSSTPSSMPPPPSPYYSNPTTWSTHANNSRPTGVDPAQLRQYQMMEAAAAAHPISYVLTSQLNPTGVNVNATEVVATAAAAASSATTVKSRPYICEVEGCGKAYVRAEHLKRHVRSIHTNDKPYECPAEGCGREFSRYDNLVQHYKGVHGPTMTRVPRPTS